MVTITQCETLEENQARYRELERREQQREEELRALERTVWGLAGDLHRNGTLTCDNLVRAAMEVVPERQRADVRDIAESYLMRNRSSLGL